ncbi:MAG: Asp23/Gls24 family envelope stress response protein [Oscillospiraceae bacterium]|nr:Asp23/Gls24 family envelope stress response protein [Oscillospiraceae bacterium]
MADNKQYITQVQDNGRVLISEEVIATIVAQSLTEIEGFVTLSNKPGADYADIVGKKNWGKGIKVVISENDEITIDCNVIVTYGTSVISVAKAIQEAAVSALDSMTGISVVDVNVNVCGIVRK